MRKTTPYLSAVLLAVQASALGAQSAEKPAPKFTLTIFDASVTGVKGHPYRGVRVEETNTSNVSIVGPPCPEIRSLFRITVQLNGHPVQERDAAARKKREDTTLCKQLPDGGTIQPGGRLIRYMSFGWDYPMIEPGTYEITVSRDSDLEHPEKGVTVTSNTLTFVVPEPDAENPN